MSDKEIGSNDDLSLPKATLHKILTEICPPNEGLTTTKEFRDHMADCCVEFISLISSEANEIAEKENKKTMGPEHIMAALKELGFPEYIGPVAEAVDEFKKQQASREKKQSKIEQSGMTEAELIAQQEELFKTATDKYNAAPQGAVESK